MVYHNHSDDYAECLIQQFFDQHDFINEDYVHDKLPWHMTNVIHYCSHLKGNIGEARMWEVKSGYIVIPEEASVYTKTHFWEKQTFEE